LGRALPKCVSSSERLAKENDMDQEEDSYVAREAKCIQEAKHVWAILKDGIIQRKVVVPMTPKGKGKKRIRDYEYIEEEEKASDAEGAALPSVVSEHAWPVLDWLLMVLDKDQLLTERDGLRESILLSSDVFLDLIYLRT
jgi:hypothetical protein